MPLLICRTCPRYGSDSGSFGEALAAAVTGPAHARGVRVSHIPCLGGCPNAGNVALDASGKPRVRFSRITPDDVGALLDATAEYDASESGHPEDWRVPPEIAGRMTAVTPKRLPVPATRRTR